MPHDSHDRTSEDPRDCTTVPATNETGQCGTSVPGGVTRRRYLRALGSAAAVGGLATGTASGPAAASSHEADVYSEGGTWFAEAHGSEVYAGGDVFGALQAAVDNLSAGRTSKETVVLQDDATASLSGNGVELPSHTALDLRGTIELSDAGGIPIYADQAESIEVTNYSLVGTADVGMRIQRSSDVHLGTIELEMPGGGLGIRIDNAYDRGAITTTDVVLEEAVVSGNDAHAVETYGVDGIEVGHVFASDTSGCGLLFNDTTNAEVGTVVGHRAPESGGYATFRTANDAGPNVHVEHVTSVDSGRGLFNVSSSGGVTIDNVHVVNSPILIQNAYDYEIAGGLVKDNGGEAIRVDSRNDGSHVPTENVTVRDVRFVDRSDAGTAHAVRETGPGTSSNQYLDNDVRDGPYDEPFVLFADDSVVEGTVTGSADLPASGTYRIEAVHSGKALTVLDEYDADGAPVGQHAWENWSTQHWQVEPVGGGVYRIECVHGGKALDVDARSVRRETALQQWAPTDGQNQRFHVVARGGGEYSVEAEHSGMALDVLEASAEDGAAVVQWPWTGADNQRWQFVPVDGQPESPPSGEQNPCEAAGAPEGARSAEVDGQTVCDLDGDELYVDVTGDGAVDHRDVVHFFQHQHTQAWKRPDLFDFSGSDDVGHGDVVALFHRASTL